MLGFTLVSNLREKGFKHLDYWRRSIYAATAARMLAGRVGVIQEEEAFLAGLLVNPANSDWLTSLRTTYENLGIEPNPVLERGTTLSLRSEAPYVRDQLTRSAEMVLRLFKESGKSEEAQELQNRVLKEYSLRPEVSPRKS